jgi:hypothetical protein
MKWSRQCVVSKKHFFVDVADIRKEALEVFHHEEEVVFTNARDMTKENLDIEDDDDCVGIPNFIPFLDGFFHN